MFVPCGSGVGAAGAPLPFAGYSALGYRKISAKIRHYAFSYILVYISASYVAAYVFGCAFDIFWCGDSSSRRFPLEYNILYSNIIIHKIKFFILCSIKCNYSLSINK